MDPSGLRAHSVSPAWRFALIGALISVPLSVVIDRLPRSEVDFGFGILIFGTVIAGVLASRHETDSAAAGSRAGLLGAFLTIISGIVPMYEFYVLGPVPAGQLVAAIAGYSVLFPLLALIFSWVGLAFGRFGGWIATLGRSDSTADPA